MLDAEADADAARLKPALRIREFRWAVAGAFEASRLPRAVASLHSTNPQCPSPNHNLNPPTIAGGVLAKKSTTSLIPR
ncbi:hypothetical protein M5D96_005360 [Drosophila gunungcola]|uniref:Uncharacterized protein n=1 Tax=Drosophila gunungcola TaxID=103775 RepID=A0A9P9YQV9_9MUSC|nr:hypothetical protein M5D96_005360 [Drosophila gunungcola]